MNNQFHLIGWTAEATVAVGNSIVLKLEYGVVMLAFLASEFANKFVLGVLVHQINSKFKKCYETGFKWVSVAINNKEAVWPIKQAKNNGLTRYCKLLIFGNLYIYNIFDLATI